MTTDLPHLLTDSAIEGPRSAETQVMSAMALFECGASALGWVSLGHEDVMESVAGVASTAHRYRATPATGTCDSAPTSQSFFDQLMGARRMISTSPGRLVPTGQGRGTGVYDRIQDEWELGIEGERLSAIAAIYMTAVVDYFGEFFCEAAFDESDLVTSDELLALAEVWSNRALMHIDAFGDFAMPNAAASSARNMALAMRSRIRWAADDLTGAVADAQAVLASDPAFEARITREAGETRRNKIYQAAQQAGFSVMLGVIDWWRPELREPNPVTGEPWPDPIPHTGYLFLGIMPDGRTLEPGNVPVRWAEEDRDASRSPIPLGNGAVPDTRVEHTFMNIAGPGIHELPEKFDASHEDIPLVTWRELLLIQADEALSRGALGEVLGLVNQLRGHHGLPEISGAYESALLSDPQATRHVLLEERRRELFSEGGRYWSTKIKNTDVLWFPRGEGQTPFQGYELLGGVRMFFPGDEYERNPHFLDRGGLDARGTGCLAEQRGVPGSV